MMGSKTLIPVDRVMNADARRDLALLEVHDAATPALRLGAYSKLEIGQEIFVIGNPEGLEGTISTGIISGLRELRGDRYIQITAPISHGSSGGAVINSAGEVIGVATFILGEGQNLNFAIPVDDIRPLLSRTDAGEVTYTGPAPNNVRSGTLPSASSTFAERIREYLRRASVPVDEFKGTTRHSSIELCGPERRQDYHRLGK
jgi:hypothetical protein